MTNALVTLPKEFGADFLNDKFKEVEAEVLSQVFEVDTEDGRKHVKEFALKINKSKTVLDNPMRAHLKELKALPKVLEENARDSKRRFEKLRESVLEPLSAARERQHKIIERLNEIVEMCHCGNTDSEHLEKTLKQIQDLDHSMIWPELKKKFNTALEAATTSVTVTLERITLQEQQAAELAELQAKQAAAEKKEADRLVAEAAAKEATEAAERKAKAEKEAIERRAVEAKQREEKARADAEQAKYNAEQAEKRRLQEIEDNKVRAELAKKQAQEAQKAAIKKAEADERYRAEQEELAKKAAEEKRKADYDHRSKINRANLTALMAVTGVDEETGKKVIVAIANGQLPNTEIKY